MYVRRCPWHPLFCIKTDVCVCVSGRIFKRDKLSAQVMVEKLQRLRPRKHRRWYGSSGRERRLLRLPFSHNTCELPRNCCAFHLLAIRSWELEPFHCLMPARALMLYWSLVFLSLFFCIHVYSLWSKIQQLILHRLFAWTLTHTCKFLSLSLSLSY